MSTPAEAMEFGGTTASVSTHATGSTAPFPHSEATDEG